MSAHCAAERRPQGTIRQRRIFGIGDASPRCRRRLGCASRAQARGGSLLHHVPNRPPRFPTSTPPPGPSAHPSGFSIRSQQDSIGCNPTAFKAPVRTSVATEFNSGEHGYDTIPTPHPSIRALGILDFGFFRPLRSLRPNIIGNYLLALAILSHWQQFPTLQQTYIMMYFVPLRVD